MEVMLCGRRIPVAGGGLGVLDFEWFLAPAPKALSEHQLALIDRAEEILSRAESECFAICDRVGAVAREDLNGYPARSTGQPCGQRRPRSLGKSVHVNLLMESGMLTEVDHLAARLGVSRSDVIRGCIRYGRGRYERSTPVEGPIGAAAPSSSGASATPTRPRITGA